jgi:hypothetical protein
MLGGQTLPLADILSRVSEEAEAFGGGAARPGGGDSAQRSLKPPPRFRIAGTKAPAQAGISNPGDRLRIFVLRIHESESRIHEFRQVISVDGRPIATPEKGMH